MADKNIDELPLATSLNTVDLFHLRQGGIDKKLPAQDLIDLLPAGPTGPEGPQGPQGLPGDSPNAVVTNPADGMVNVIISATDYAALTLGAGDAGFTTEAFQIRPNGIGPALHSFRWDGSGTLASGAILWDSLGALTLQNYGSGGDRILVVDNSGVVSADTFSFSLAGAIIIDPTDGARNVISVADDYKALTLLNNDTGDTGSAFEILRYTSSQFLVNWDGSGSMADGVISWDTTGAFNAQNYYAVGKYAAGLASPSSSVVSSTSLETIANGDTHWANYSYAGDNSLILGTSGGTFASPTALTSGNQMAALSFRAYNGTSFVQGAAMQIVSNGIWSGSNRGSDFWFYGTMNGSTSNVIWHKLFQGRALFGLSPSDDGVNRMQVYGSTYLGGDTTITGTTITLSGLHADRVLGLDGSKNVVVYTVSGTGTELALTASPTFTGTVTGAASTWSGQVKITSSGVTPSTAAIFASSVEPSIQLNATTEGVDGRNWAFTVLGNKLYLQAYQSTGGDADSWLEVTRTPNTKTISALDFPSTAPVSFGGTITGAAANWSGAQTVTGIAEAFVGTATTGPISTRYNSTGGQFYTGMDNSAGNNFNSSAYSGVLWRSGNNPISFVTNATSRMVIGGSGLVSTYAGLYVEGDVLEIQPVGGSAKNLIALGAPGANYGFISNVSTGVWSLSWGPTKGTLGTAALTWNTSGAVGITGTLTGAASTWSGTAAFGTATLGVPSVNTLTHIFAGIGVYAAQDVTGGEVDYGNNFYYNSGWKYRTTGQASRISFLPVSTTLFSVFTATSGSANAAITWTQAFTIDDNSNTLIGATSGDGSKLYVNGTANIIGAITASNNLTVLGSLYGSSGTLTIADNLVFSAYGFTGAGAGYLINDGSGNITSTNSVKPWILSNTFSNADHVVPTGTTFVEQIGTMSDNRQVTLDTVANYAIGEEVTICDASGTVTIGTAEIDVVAHSGENIQFAAGLSSSITKAYGAMKLVKISTSEWLILSLV